MRYNDLIESKNNVQLIGERIKKQCKPFLAEIKNQPLEYPLWRGFKAPADARNAGMKLARLEERNPESTSPQDHMALNNFFVRRYGHPYRNGIFATGMEQQAQDYGRAYMIYPIGKFDYLWHTQIYDMYGDVIAKTESPRGEKLWWAYANDLGIHDEDKFEMLLDNADLTDFLNWLWIKNGWKKTDLVKAIKSENEIMIWAEKYYYLSAEAAQQIKW